MSTIVRSDWVSTSMAFETKCHKPLWYSVRTSVSISGGKSRLSHRLHMRQSEFEIYVLGLYISSILTPISNSN